MIAERNARNVETSDDMSWPENDIHAPPPSVKVLFRFMDAYRFEYTKWKTKSYEFRKVKGIFVELACRYGLELLWYRVSNGANCNPGWRYDTRIHSTKDGHRYAFRCVGFVKHFPVSVKGTAVKAATSMFEPDTLLYPITAVPKNPSTSQKTAVENNPLLDLVFNLRASNENEKGVVQVWIQVKHTENMKPLQKKTITAAMEVVQTTLTIAKLNELRNQELQIIPISGLPIKTTWSLIWLKGKRHAPVAAALLTHIKKEKNSLCNKTLGNNCNNIEKNSKFYLRQNVKKQRTHGGGRVFRLTL